VWVRFNRAANHLEHIERQDASQTRTAAAFGVADVPQLAGQRASSSPNIPSIVHTPAVVLAIARAVSRGAGTFVTARACVAILGRRSKVHPDLTQRAASGRRCA